MADMGTPAGFDELPGGDLIRNRLADLEHGHDTPAAALVSMAAPRLRAAGLPAPKGDAEAGHRLYALLASEDPATAHSRYNALVGRVVSFARALEHASTG